jgi:F-type H+-transporting ATPase subunit delta
VATVVADKLKTDRRAIIREAASWLVDTGRERQAAYLARDVASILSDRGYVLMRVTSARRLGDEAMREVEKFVREATGAKQLEVETVVDPSLVGGVKVELPGAAIDASVASKLAKLVEGASNG